MLRRTIGVSAALLGSDTTIHPIPGYELTALQGGDLANISAIILDQDDMTRVRSPRSTNTVSVFPFSPP